MAQLRVIAACVLRSDSNAVDVGANIGETLRLFVGMAPSGKHFAFEPIPDMATALTEQFPGVTVIAAALSDHAGQAEFVHVRTAPSLSGLKRIPLPTGPSLRLEDRVMPAAGDDRLTTLTVETLRLDDALPAGYVPHLVKVDVEGAEHLVLAGAVNTLRRHRPVVVFEHGMGGAPAYGANSDDVFAILDEVGMRIFDLDGDGPYSRSRFEEVFRAGTRWNFLATA
jgi:FkbM family methyltransferase